MEMDKLAIKKKILEELLAHMDDSQGKDLHENFMSKKPKVSMLEVEASPMDKSKMGEMKDKPGIDEEADDVSMGDKGKMGDEDEMDDDELEELLKSLA